MEKNTGIQNARKGCETMNTEKKQGSLFELPRGFGGRVILWFMNRAHKSFYENVAKVLNLQPEDDLLEVACGNGHFLKKHASHVRTITGLDLSELCIKIAVRKNKERVAAGTAEFVLGEATQLPWEDNRFSVAASIAGIMILPEPLESLKEIHRVLNPGGRVVIGIEWHTEDGNADSKDNKKYGIQTWTEKDVRDILEEAGFSDIAITYAKRLIMPKVMIAHGVKK
jgi:ubiquinone/menaquinone biosynthesis C-methylase UbiE